MKGATMLATLQKLGVVPSFSRPSVSDDNPYSESLFRTLKYTPAYPGKPFESIEAAPLISTSSATASVGMSFTWLSRPHQWVHGFVQWYNEEHRHSAIRYVTPGQRHRGEDVALLQSRRAVYKSARQQRPGRWSGRTRNWDPVKEVWLNLPKEHQADKEDKPKAA